MRVVVTGGAGFIGANLCRHLATLPAVYGATPTLPRTEDLPTRPMSPYGASKLAAEWYALSYQHSMDLPVLAFRFFNVFGLLQPADHVYAAVIPRFIDAALNGGALTIYGDGKQSRVFTYVDTVCASLCRAVVDQVTSPTPVNLAFGQPCTQLDVVDELRTGDIRHSGADATRLYELLPGTEPTPFRNGLSATIDWFRNQ